MWIDASQTAPILRRLVRPALTSPPIDIGNKNAQGGSGDHEVHDLASTRGCLPNVLNRIDLGW